MRNSLFSVLLAPLAVLGSAVPSHSTEAREEWAIEGTISSFDPSHATIHIKIPQELAIEGDRLSLQLHVLESENPCGYGNITLDGQVLSQRSRDGSIFRGRGPLSIAQKHRLDANWKFECNQTEGQPDQQLLTFIVDSINRKSVQNIGFSLNFIQTTDPRIIDPLADASAEESTDPEGIDVPTFDDDLAELDFLYGQLEELKFLIQEKKLAIAGRNGRFHQPITKCDSLSCVAQTIGGEAQHAMDKLIRKVKRSYAREGSGHFVWRPRPPFDHEKPGNHTCDEREESGHFRWRPRPGDRPPCGPPKHGKGNHTHPRPAPPHFRKPHLRLPFCRHPPPPHHRPGHERPPHHRPSFAQLENHPPNIDHHWVPPSIRPGQGGLNRHERPLLGQERGRGGSRFPNGHGYFVDRPHHRPGGPRVLHVLGLGLTVFLLTLLAQSLRRRCSSPSKREARQARQARQEERRSRRSHRHAAHKEAFNNFLARIGCQVSHAQLEEDAEKHASLDDGLDSTTVTDDLTELRNAADMVTDMIAAEEGRSRRTRARASPPLLPRCHRGRRGMYAGAGDLEHEEEPLPAYEDCDSSEIGSVADGCRYTPGSSDYTPSQAGSASEYLGPDVKE